LVLLFYAPTNKTEKHLNPGLFDPKLALKRAKKVSVLVDFTVFSNALMPNDSRVSAKSALRV